MTLHIVSNPNNLNQCLKVARPQDVLILTEECSEISGLLFGALNDVQQQVYWLSDGVQGADPEHGVWIDYAGFVSLCESHTPIQSWY